jgi:hypothetical protein
MNKVLYGHVATGPTYKNRVVDNILNYESYKYFDVLILTDDPNYHLFDSIRNYKNVFIEDINKYRSNFKQFDKFEVLPESTLDEIQYANQIKNLASQKNRYPLHLQRFMLIYEKISDYKYLLMADCDMKPVMTPDGYEKFMSYLDNDMPENSVSSNRCYYPWQDREYVKEFLFNISNELNREIKDYNLIDGFDNPMKIFKLDSPEKYKSLFDTWNYCLFKAFNDDKDYFIVPMSWGIASEIILSIIYKLENIKVNKEAKDYLGLEGIKSFTYPEDRFWDDLSHRGFDISGKSKKEFIENNFVKLKNFYLEFNQHFPYE